MPLSFLLLAITNLAFMLYAAPAAAQQPVTPTPMRSLSMPPTQDIKTDCLPHYVLGPEDQVSVWALDLEELSGKTFTIDRNGVISLPLVGRFPIGGLTTQEAEEKLVEALKHWVHAPQVAISVVAFQSQPVSIVGAVANPGIRQLKGCGSLLEMLTEAGGLRQDAGASARITRQMEYGPIPLPKATQDLTGKLSFADVNLRTLLGSESSADNISLKPHDVINIPTAPLIYVMGQVMKPGGFPLNDRDSITALQALTLAGGQSPMSNLQSARILRQEAESTKRTELAINLKAVIAGKTNDVLLMPNDMLWIPDSTSRKITSRIIEQVIQTGSVMLTWGVIH